MNDRQTASGGSVEADVEGWLETLRVCIEDVGPRTPEVDQALTNLTDRIGELEQEVKYAQGGQYTDVMARNATLQTHIRELEAEADKGPLDKFLAMKRARDEALVRIHYLEGRVGKLEDLLREAQDVIAALSPPMKGTLDEGA